MSANTGVNIRVEVQLNNIDRELVRLAGEVDQFRTPLRNSATYMEGSIGKRFRSGGGSRPWKKLAPSTIERHPHRAGGKPLLDTGALRGSATTGANQRITSKRLNYTFGSGVPYAGAHNFGYKHIPQRQFLYFDDKDERAIKKVFSDYIKELLNNV